MSTPESQPERPAPQGWHEPLQSRKFHFWLTGQFRSLCGRWGAPARDETDTFDTNHHSHHNCVVCARERDRMAKAGAI